MKRSHALRRAGVTLTELLVVLVIVSILSTIAVPVYINKAENARRATAEAECRMIADAEESCVMHHGFYVPLQVLDDMPINPDATFNNTDTIDNEQVFLIDPYRNLTTLGLTQTQLDPVSTDPRVLRMIKTWQGPFLNPQRVFMGDASFVDPATAGSLNQADLPLDPWGQPYRFYAPEPWGVIGTNAAADPPVVLNLTTAETMGDGLVTTDDVKYDRYAIVSFGPNGVPNDNLTATSIQDDVVYFFGRILSPSTVDGGTSGTATATPTPAPTVTPP